MKNLRGILVMGLVMILGQAAYAAEAPRDRGYSARAESSESASQSRESRGQERRAERAERRARRVARSDSSASGSRASSASRDRVRPVVRSVPELDGTFAFLAFGLVAGIGLVIREQLKK